MYKSRRARSGDGTNPDALHWQQGSSKDGEWERVSGNRYMRGPRVSETEMRAFGTFLSLPGSKIPTTERPHGAKLASNCGGLLHPVKHHEGIKCLDSGRETCII